MFMGDEKKDVPHKIFESLTHLQLLILIVEDLFFKKTPFSNIKFGLSMQIKCDNVIIDIVWLLKRISPQSNLLVFLCEICHHFLSISPFQEKRF